MNRESVIGGQHAVRTLDGSTVHLPERHDIEAQQYRKTQNIRMK